MEMLLFLLAPFAASLILTGIHAYLGVHVVERGVIFVDLSLAQIAALGTTVAVLYGIEPHSHGAYVVSLAFTFIGAAVFSTIRGQKARIPQEKVGCSGRGAPAHRDCGIRSLPRNSRDRLNTKANPSCDALALTQPRPRWLAASSGASPDSRAAPRAGGRPQQRSAG